MKINLVKYVVPIVIGLTVVPSREAEAEADAYIYGPYLSGNKLLKLCESDEALEENLCWFYIIGVADSSETTSITKELYCVPGGVPASQLARVTVKYLNSHPERLHEAGALLAIEAIIDAFPCQ